MHIQGGRRPRNAACVGRPGVHRLEQLGAEGGVRLHRVDVQRDEVAGEFRVVDRGQTPAEFLEAEHAAQRGLADGGEFGDAPGLVQ